MSQIVIEPLALKCTTGLCKSVQRGWCICSVLFIFIGITVIQQVPLPALQYEIAIWTSMYANAPHFLAITCVQMVLLGYQNCIFSFCLAQTQEIYCNMRWNLMNEKRNWVLTNLWRHPDIPGMSPCFARRSPRSGRSRYEHFVLCSVDRQTFCPRCTGAGR